MSKTNELFLKDNWETYQLSQICSLRSGKTPSTKKPEYWCNHKKEEECECINWYTGKDITQGNLETERKITQLAVQKCKMTLTTNSSLLFFHIECLPFHSAQNNTTCNQIISLLEPDLKIVIPLFLYYSLLAERNKLRVLRTGSVQMFTKQSHLVSFPLSLPPLPIQQQILQKFQLVYNTIYKTEVQYNDTLLKIIQKYLEIGDLLFLKNKDSEIKVGEKFQLVRGKAYNIKYKIGEVKWISSGDLTACYFLTEKSKVSKLITKEDLLNYKLNYIKQNSLLIADREFNSQKIVWSQTDNCVIGGNVVNLFNEKHIENATLLFSFRQINWSIWQTGSVIKQLPIKILQNISFCWVSCPKFQTRLFLLLNSPLAKIKDLLLLKYFRGKN